MFIPLYDHNPVDKIPIVTYGIIGLNLLVWIVFQHAGFGEGYQASLCNFALIPADLLNNLSHSGMARPGGYICYFGEPHNFETLITHMFMHGGWMHLLGNMWFLWIFGDNIENALGKVKFLLFYLLCGVVAAGLQVATEMGSYVPMVGASGAVSGVMGAYILLHPRARIKTLVFLLFFITVIEVPAIVILGMYIATQVFSGLVLANEGVAFWAHVGGFACGALLIKLLKPKEATFNLRIERQDDF